MAMKNWHLFYTELTKSSSIHVLRTFTIDIKPQIYPIICRGLNKTKSSYEGGYSNCCCLGQSR